jgi:hypothetical protein
MTYHLDLFKIDGIHYADLQHVEESFREGMCARGVVWETEFTLDGIEYCGNVIAANQTEAVKIADARGLGEKVIGPWQEAEA